MNKAKVIFSMTFFIMPLFFLVTSILWRVLVVKNQLKTIILDSFSITAIYFFVVSLWWIINWHRIIERVK